MFLLWKIFYLEEDRGYVPMKLKGIPLSRTFLQPDNVIPTKHRQQHCHYQMERQIDNYFSNFPKVSEQRFFYPNAAVFL